MRVEPDTLFVIKTQLQESKQTVEPYIYFNKALRAPNSGLRPKPSIAFRVNDSLVDLAIYDVSLPEFWDRKSWTFIPPKRDCEFVVALETSLKERILVLCMPYNPGLLKFIAVSSYASGFLREVYDDIDSRLSCKERAFVPRFNASGALSREFNMAHRHDDTMVFELTDVSRGSPSRHNDEVSPVTSDRAILVEGHEHPDHSTPQEYQHRYRQSTPIDTDSFLDERPSEETPAQKAHGNSEPGYLSVWLWELGAVCVSVSCMVAIIAILFMTSGKALSAWSFPIAPNSLVSVFSTLAKSALMVSVAACLGQLKWIYFGQKRRELSDFEAFEEASRGPWGALMFLWCVRFRAKLALFAALITLVALAFDPFTQQILQFPSRSMAQPGKASFGIAHAYDSGIELAKTKTVFELPIEAQIQGAIMSGLYNVDAPVKVTCPTGNCPWPEFTTLALSSNCHNATEGTVTNCTSNGPSLRCTYLTPGGYNLSTSAGFSKMGSSYTILNSTAVTEWDRYSDWANSTLVRFAIVNLTDTRNAQGGHDVAFRSPYILECDMRWYARTFHALRVTNGSFAPGPTTDHALEGVPVNTTSANQAIEFWYPGPYAYRLSSPDDNLTFLINPNDHGIIASHLAEVFSSTSRTNFGLALAQSRNLSSAIESIAASVTYALGHGRNATALPGTAYASETYVRVRWGWVLPPVGTVAMAGVLLAATMVHSRRRGVAGWKSAGLVALFTRFVGWEEDDLAVRSPEDAVRRARGMRAGFEVIGGPVLKN
ncbi:hypothetical protein F4810DRAFT_716590 [Camillea tinctor]|nr:hypothetical protein F4810DRAFT_716590 [Camillea tinctor]